MNDVKVYIRIEDKHNLISKEKILLLIYTKTGLTASSLFPNGILNFNAAFPALSTANWRGTDYHLIKNKNEFSNALLT